MDLLTCFDQLLEDGQTLENHVIADTGRKTEIFGATEIVAGHDQQIMHLSLVGELLGRTIRGFDKQIEGTLGIDAIVAITGQFLIQHSAVLIIDSQIGLDLSAGTDNHLL